MTKLDKRLKYQNDDEKPVTISMRLPKELHARLEQYATQHRQSISELVRDGLAWRLSEGDPRGLGDASAKDDEAYYMSKTANALADMRQALARQEAQIQTIVQAIDRQTTPVGNGLYSSHTTMPATEVAVRIRKRHTRSAQHWLTSRYPRAPYLPPCPRMTPASTGSAGCVRAAMTTGAPGDRYGGRAGLVAVSRVMQRRPGIGVRPSVRLQPLAGPRSPRGATDTGAAIL